MFEELTFEGEPFQGYTEFDEFEAFDTEAYEEEKARGWPKKQRGGAGSAKGRAPKQKSSRRPSGGSGGGPTSKQSTGQKQALPSLFQPCETLNQFEFDKDAVRSLHKSQLVKIATKVIESQNSSDPVRQIKVIGHTDPKGTEAYNVGLGSRRAARVANALRETMERMKPGSSAAVNFAVESRGEKEPVGKDGALNRRVEICLPILAQPQRLKSGEKSFKVVAKSYITKLNVPAEMRFLPCGDRTNKGALEILLSRINDTGVSAALSDAKDRGYRLYSSMTFKVQYTQGMILRLDFSPWLDTDVGQECFLGQSGCVDPPRMQWEKPLVKRVSKSAYDFFWMAKGRPNPGAEYSGFLSVCKAPRRSVDIWHAVAGHIDCSGPEPKVDVKITGSYFPSHRVFVNGAARQTIPQGNFAQLWDSDGSDPALIRGPKLDAFQKNLPWVFVGPPAPAGIGHKFNWE